MSESPPAPILPCSPGERAARTRALVRRAIPDGWLTSYFLLNLLPVASISSSIPVARAAGLLGGPPATGQELLVMGAGALGGAGLVAVVVSLAIYFLLRLEVRRALSRCERLPEQVLVVAPAYRQVAGRYRRRPAGLLLVTPERLEFLPVRDGDQQHRLSWPLAEIDRIAPTGDRFGLLARMLDIQGALELTCGAETVVLSLLACHRNTEPLQEAWGRAMAAAPGPAALSAPDTRR